MIRDWQPRPIGNELSLCQRYYAKTFPIGTAPAQNAGQDGEAFFNLTAATGAQQLGNWWFPVGMRVGPTITYYNPLAANAQARDLNTGTDCTGTVSAVAATTQVIQVQVTPPAGAAIGNIIAVQITADAEL